MKTPCKPCPFRIGSGTQYDADAIEALDDGNEPSCHCKVGNDAIFRAVIPTDAQACHGFREWQNGTAGYAKPIQVQ